MATLVTGGTGFVGSNIVKTLAQHGHQVVSFDLAAPDALVRSFVEPWADRVTFVQGDILDRNELSRVESTHDLSKVVHAAIFTGIRPDIEKEHARSIVDINYTGTANLLELATRLPLERFMCVSSGAVYGEVSGRDVPLREDANANPRNLYGVTKFAAELLTRRYGELYGFSTVSVRLSSPYGPMERVTGHRTLMSVLYELTGAAVRGEAIQVGGRSLGRDYTYVTDSAEGIRALLDAPSLSYDLYNLSSGRWIAVDEIVKTVQGLRPSLRVVDDPSTQFGIFGSAGSRPALDVSRLRDDLGFTASFDLTSGIGDYLQWREDFSFSD